MKNCTCHCAFLNLLFFLAAFLAKQATGQEIPLTLQPTQVGVNNPQVAQGQALTGFGRRSTINTWVPFVFEIPKHDGLVVKTAVLEVQIEGIDADGDGNWDDLPDTDTVEASGKGGRPIGTVLYRDFTTLYAPNESPLSPKTITMDLMQFPSIVDVLNQEDVLNVLEEDDSSCLGAQLFITFAPAPPAPGAAVVEIKPQLEGGQPLPFKVCFAAGSDPTTPSAEGFRPIPAQPKAGSFPAVLTLPATPINCVLQFRIQVSNWRGSDKDNLVFNVTVEDTFSEGLSYAGRFLSSLDGVADACFDVPTPNGRRFVLRNPLKRPAANTELQSFDVRIEYTVTLNDSATRTQFQQNSAAVAVEGLNMDTGVVGPKLNQQFPSVRINDSTPSLECEQLLSSTTGLPGDQRSITVVVRNPGNVYLTRVWVDAVLPNATTLVPGSIDPPATRVSIDPITGRPRIEWRNLSDIPTQGNGVSSLGLTYRISIDANTPQDSKLIGSAYATAVGLLLSVPNFFATLNCIANDVTLVVSPIHVGISVALESKPVSACPLQVITYTAKVVNTGDFRIENAQLRLAQAGLPLAGNPVFPLDLGALNPGDSRTITYKGQIGVFAKGALSDFVWVTGSPVNQGVSVASPLADAATATATVLPPVLSKITPASAPQGSTDFELIIEGGCFIPGTVIGFQPSDGIEIIPPTPPNYGFVGSTELRQRINIKSDAAVGQREIFVLNPNGDGAGTRPFDLFTITPLNGIGPKLELAPPSLDFRNVPVGQNKETPVTIRNTGDAPLKINAILSANPQFTIVSPSIPFTVAVGAQQSVTIRFTPTAAGNQTAALSINSNDPKQGLISLPVVGVGQSNVRSAAVRLFCLSVRVHPATASVLGQNYVLGLTSGSPSAAANGELAPYQDGMTPSHYSFFRLSGPTAASSMEGDIDIDVPMSTDANNNGIPDFFEVNQPVGSTTTQGDFASDLVDGQLTATWSRPAGSKTGTCRIKLLGPDFSLLPEFTHTFEVFEYSGYLSYTPGKTDIAGSVNLAQTSDASSTLAGLVAFTAALPNPGNALKLLAGHLTDGAAHALTYFNAAVQRDPARPANYSAQLEFEDGDPTTTTADYTVWQWVISDPNDTNHNGVPDLTDPPASTPPVSLKLSFSGTGLSLILSGNPGQIVELQEINALGQFDWSTTTSITLTSSAQSVPLARPTAGSKFYRVRMP